jgi:hypothetical protein
MGAFPESPQVLAGYLGATTQQVATASPSDGSVWRQMIASLSEESLIVAVAAQYTTNTSTATSVLVAQIGVGGAGAETAVASVVVPLSWGTATTDRAGGGIGLQVPPRLAAGTRVSMRLTAGPGITGTWNFGVTYCPVSSVDGL